jgi:NADH-ubiquinone oxidoreductase chain 1
MLSDVLVNVALITILERKIVGYSQLRTEPNKVRLAGVKQPFNDAIKLFKKENAISGTSSKIIFFLSSAIAISLSLLVFLIFPAYEKNYLYKNFHRPRKAAKSLKSVEY